MPSNLLDFRLTVVGEDEPGNPRHRFRLPTLTPPNVDFGLKRGGENHSEKPKPSFQLATVTPGTAMPEKPKKWRGNNPGQPKLGFHLATLTPSSFVALAEKW